MRATQKQLTTHYKCKNCGSEITTVTHTYMTHKEMRQVKAKRHKKNAYSITFIISECSICSEEVEEEINELFT